MKKNSFSIIRATDETEQKGCFAVRREVFVEEQGVPEELEWDDVDRRGEAVYLVAVHEGEVLGCLRLHSLDRVSLKVERLAVRTLWRGYGVGAALMEAAERWAREHGYKRLVLNAQVHVVNFYLRLGYTKISHSLFEEAGILHAAMEKSLTSAPQEI